MNGFENIFYDLEKEKKGALIVEIPMIPPNPDTQIEAAGLLVEGNIDVIQVAVPVRFPWMYGETILRIQKNAAVGDVKWRQSFEAISKIKAVYPKAEVMPVGFYGGLNRMGQENYIKRCKELGIRAVDVPDYPNIHDADPKGLVSALKKEKIHYVNIIDTNLAMAEKGTNGYRILEQIIKKASGFIFLLAVPGGKTGTKKELDFTSLEIAKKRIQSIQDELKLRCPLVAVCGISTPQQVSTIVKDMGMHVMFGSAFIKRIKNNESAESILEFLHSMKHAAS